jgi:hypothetical protein
MQVERIQQTGRKSVESFLAAKPVCRLVLFRGVLESRHQRARKVTAMGFSSAESRRGRVARCGGTRSGDDSNVRIVRLAFHRPDLAAGGAAEVVNPCGPAQGLEQAAAPTAMRANVMHIWSACERKPGKRKSTPDSDQSCVRSGRAMVRTMPSRLRLNATHLRNPLFEIRCGRTNDRGSGLHGGANRSTTWAAALFKKAQGGEAGSKTKCVCL